MLEKLLAKYTPFKITLLFALFSVIIANIITTIVMSFIHDPALLIAHGAATITSFLAAIALAGFSSKLFFKMMDARFEAIENYKTDSLTGLHSRKPFIEDLEKLIEVYSDSNQSFALVMIDLDYFKKVNDTYGHLGGDAIMQEIGRILRSVIGTKGMIGRFGGEEFILSLLDYNQSDLNILLDTLRASLDSSIEYRHQTIKFSASIGCYYTSKPSTIDELLRLADTQLYLAKENGRNRYELHIDL